METPQETERGAVNGVQSALNKLMDMLKYILVILFPWKQTFGYLIIVSVSSCIVGEIFFIVYAVKHRTLLYGHI